MLYLQRLSHNWGTQLSNILTTLPPLPKYLLTFSLIGYNITNLYVWDAASVSAIGAPQVRSWIGDTGVNQKQTYRWNLGCPTDFPLWAERNLSCVAKLQDVSVFFSSYYLALKDLKSSWSHRSQELCNLFSAVVWLPLSTFSLQDIPRGLRKGALPRGGNLSPSRAGTEGSPTSLTFQDFR